MNLKDYLKNLETLNPELVKKLPSWVKELKEIVKESEQENKNDN